MQSVEGATVVYAVSTLPGIVSALLVPTVVGVLFAARRRLARLLKPGNATMLDAEEYFHLALHASSMGDHHACMTYLEEVLQRQPRNARAIYLRAVQPGTYALYGPLVIGANGAAFGVCMCMGSVRFEARAGEIVDMGEIRFDGVGSGGEKGRFGPDGHRLPAAAVVPPRADAARPARLANMPYAPASLHAADRMPNYFGVLIDRLAPIPGVLGYERGRVIDLAGGEGTGGSR